MNRAVYNKTNNPQILCRIRDYLFYCFEGLYLAGFSHLSSHSKKVRCHSTPFEVPYPVVFVRIDKQFGRNATHHGCIEGGHCLVGKDAEVLLSVDAEDRVSHLSTKRCGELAKCVYSRSVVLFPISAAHIPVGKPFLRFQILHFHVEDTVVRGNALEAFVMVSGKPIYGEASEAGALRNPGGLCRRKVPAISSMAVK